jgi:ABC-type protease/lipase transport system fused ATPase/permease subunit
MVFKFPIRRKMAEIHEVIEQLPQGYQTPLGEHGKLRNTCKRLT